MGQHGRAMKDIHAIKTINIKLEYSVDKLLQQNEILHKESETLKRHYKELYDSIKITRNQTKVNLAFYNRTTTTTTTTYPIPSERGIGEPIVVPISTREPKRNVNQSVATPVKKTVVVESTNQKPKNKIRKQYEHVSKKCRWWFSKIILLGYKWKLKTNTVNVTPNLVEIILFIFDSGCSKYITGNLKLLSNFMEKFLGTVKFRNDQIASILGYEDMFKSWSPKSRKCSSVIRDSSTSNEMDLLFSLMFDELRNGTTLVMSNSSDVTIANTPDHCQQHNTTPSTSTTIAADTPPLNIQTTPESTSQATTVTSTKNIN
uniref:Integrase, catalytic region, zinc finger, CCHC-type, peptidase aspartic, catalytic n=1 Tax=Tanacetum cinerariifolium TaxID=118510 RepID=A0A699GQH1_TANCI|nr:integrase, catalytic region, zinc finger, CCHC-type, peptidase aspartic, catalytic [Tanacetum cinerariifolium]